MYSHFLGKNLKEINFHIVFVIDFRSNKKLGSKKLALNEMLSKMQKHKNMINRQCFLAPKAPKILSTP